MVNKKLYDEHEVHDYGRPYLPERNYLANKYVPFGKPKCHFCDQCKDYYKLLNNLELTDEKMPVRCVGDISQYNDIDQGEMSDEEYANYNIYADPVTFAKAEFDWTPRWYQEEMLRCSSLRKVVRAGRRSGKSECMAVMILYLMYTRKNFQILVVCPYQSQVDRVFEIIRNLLGQSLTYSDSVKKNTASAPQTIVLHNGSQVKGFSSGAKSGGKSTQIRGQDAHAVFLDEMDYLGDEDLEAIMAILASHPNCLLWASSTPTGARGYFFNWLTDKSLRFKEFHFISSESPSWTDEVEHFFRSAYTDAGYSREFLAEFGEEAHGVYRNADLNTSLEDYSLKNCAFDPMSRYIVGVDWNQNAGTHMVVVQCSSTGDGPSNIQYKLVDKIIVPRQEFTQIIAVEKIIQLYHKWSADYIYVDAGYGATQVEMLKKFGKDNPRLNFERKIKPVDMAGNLIIRDPVTGQEIKKPAKPFMVGVSAKQVEEGKCVFPRSEDTNAVISEEEDSAELVGLVQQMRMFKVEKISKSGQPTYSQGFEHTLVAWQLAIVGFFLEFSDVRRGHINNHIAFSGRIGEAAPDPEDRAKKSEEIKEKMAVPPRTLAPNHPGNRNVVVGTRKALEYDSLRKKREFEYRKKHKGRGYGGPGKRTNF